MIRNRTSLPGSEDGGLGGGDGARVAHLVVGGDRAGGGGGRRLDRRVGDQAVQLHAQLGVPQQRLALEGARQRAGPGEGKKTTGWQGGRKKKKNSRSGMWPRLQGFSYHYDLILPNIRCHSTTTRTANFGGFRDG